MIRLAGVSARSFLIAGMSAAVVGAAVVTPVCAPAVTPARISATVELTSLSSGLAGIAAGVQGIFDNIGDFSTGIQTTIDRVLALPDGVQAAIKNAYDNAERWPAYAASWTQFSLGLIPGLWWIAPSIPLGYKTAEPLVRAGVYSFADAIGLDPAQAVRDIREGVSTSSDNARTYGKAWADSLVAVPTLPDYPGPLPSAQSAQGLAPAAAVGSPAAAPQAAAVTSGIESAIKNTYNAVEPWVAWGFQLAQWGMGFVPGLWWFAPGVSLAYYSIEPLVQAGVFTFADVLGLNFAQIGPDIRDGIQQSAQNVVNYALAWLQSLVPFPPRPPIPPRPGAAVAAPTARAAAAIPAAETAAPEATSATAPAGDSAPGDDTAPAVQTTGPARGNTAAPDDAVAPAVDTTAETGTVAPATDSPATVAQTTAPTVADEATAPSEAPAAEAPKPTRGTHLGHRSPAGSAAPKAGDGAAAKAGRSGRSAE